jgi:hypothetical protein
MSLPAQFETLEPKAMSEWNVEFTNYKGESMEMSPIIDQLSIFESIYNNCMFGNMKLRDGTGFVEANAIVGSGEEKILFEILTEKPESDGTLTTNIEKEFRINSIANGSKNPKFTSYDIGICSPYLYVNNKKKLSRSYMKMTASEIVDQIGAEILKFGTMGDWTDLKTTPTKHIKEIVVPNWNPFQVINFLAKNSVSSNGSSNYLFFENNDGFKFTTIDDLKKAEPKRIYTLKDRPVGSHLHKGKMSIDAGMMEQYSEQVRFDISKGQMNGQYATSMLTHNILKKKLDKYSVEYDADKHKGFAEGIGINGPPSTPFTDFNADQHTGFMSSNYMYDIHHLGENSHYCWYDMKRAELRTNTVKFDIPGDSNLFAGDLVTLVIATDMKTQAEPENQFMTGNWLVTAIHHKINNDGYTMTLECMKDGFFADPDAVLASRT